MSAFETTSLFYAKLQAYGGVGTVIIGVATFILAFAGVVIARGQLKQLVQQVKDGKEGVRSIALQVAAAVEANKISRLESLLTLEGAIADRRLVLREAGIKLAELGEAKQKGNPVEEYELQGASLRYTDAAEMYLNALDRLCFCFLNGQLSEDELRGDYRDLINSAVKKDFKDELSSGTNHRNIVKVYERWADL
jgi:hypothetical protein